MNYITIIKHNILVFLDKILIKFYYYKLPNLLYRKGETAPYILKIKKRGRHGKTKWTIVYYNDKKEILIYNSGYYLFKIIKEVITVIKDNIHRTVEINEKDCTYRYYN